MIWNRDGIIWYSEDVVSKYLTTLQEIKEFCKKEIEYFDNNDNYGQQADWIALLQIITKAESEGSNV